MKNLLDYAFPEKKNLEQQDEELIAAIQSGLPLCARPYQEIGRQIGLDEKQVIARLQRMQQQGLIKRMGVIVHHRQLGYRANAKVVRDIPDDKVSALGSCMGQFEGISLFYQRPRHLPDWPYNLFCMIHGQDRDEVLANIDTLIERCSLEQIAHHALFSRRCFKQRGAKYKQQRQVSSQVKLARA